MNPYLIIIFTIISVLSFSSCSEKPADKPNIILIMSDDQGWGDSELNGNSIIDTPNLNKLASSGTSFERFYVSPMCAPTRASLMTGRYNLRTGVTWVCGRTEYLELQETTLAQILQKEGYSTALFGKWHLGEYGPYHPNERGFEKFFGILQGSTPNYFRSNLDYNGTLVTTKGYITDIFTDSAINYIEKNQGNPFFCFLSYNVPHHPYQAPEKYFNKYKERGVKDDKTASVYGMIDNMDENIGRLLEKLKDWDLEKNTVIIFMSDNGPAFPRFNDGLKGIKTQVDEGSVRTPFYILWEDHFPANVKNFQVAAHIDILPTLLDITGTSMPDSLDIDGISLLPVIKDPTKEIKDRIFYIHQNNIRECLIHPGGLRTDKYRLLNWKSGYELYDMINDPSQKRNIAADYPEITSELIRKYESWFEEVTSEALPFPPVPVGYKDYGTVKIIAPDAVLTGDLHYRGNWGCHLDWIVNWANEVDSAVWELEIYSEGDYQFVLEYNCLPDSKGTEFKLSSGQNSVHSVIKTPFHSEKTKLPNNVGIFSPPVKEWAELNFGEMKLMKGRQNLILTSPLVSGSSDIEIKSLSIIRN